MAPSRRAAGAASALPDGRSAQSDLRAPSETGRRPARSRRVGAAVHRHAASGRAIELPDAPRRRTAHRICQPSFHARNGDAPLRRGVTRRARPFLLRSGGAAAGSRCRAVESNRRAHAARSRSNGGTEGRHRHRCFRTVRSARPATARTRCRHSRRTPRVRRRLLHAAIPAAARPGICAAARTARHHHVGLHDRHAAGRQRLLHHHHRGLEG